MTLMGPSCFLQKHNRCIGRAIEGIHCQFQVSIKMIYNSFTKIIILCRHFDKDRSGKLEHQEFKSCLRSLGYDIALMESGETDPEFEAILDQVDPNR